MSLNLDSYTLTFSDEFTGSYLDTSVWSTKYWWGGRSLSSNGEKQYFADRSTPIIQKHPHLDPFNIVADPSQAEDGILTITANRSPDTGLTDGLPYVSGMINSYGTFSQTYGYFEINAQVPSGQGLWPAFWMLPQSGNWPPEIDVLELLGHDPTTYYVGAHWEGTDGSHQYQTNGVSTGIDLSQGFHSYGTLWTPDTITFYLDGQEVGSMAAPEGMDEPMYLLAALTVGGNWPGDPDATTAFPAEFQIDSIKVWAFALEGTGNNDVLTGTENADHIFGYAGDDNLAGLAGNDTLNGGDGRDILNGGAGGDFMLGGAGNDWYVVDNAIDEVRETVEVAGAVDAGGADTVQSSISYTLGAYLEDLTLSGANSIHGTGNELNNIITGNAAANTLLAGLGNDRLKGGAGADTLDGSGGIDTADYSDKSGAVLVTLNGSANRTVSVAGIAEDTIRNVENLIGGAAGDRLTGDSLVNVLNGGAGNDVLNGAAGKDTLMGGIGLDTFVFSSSAQAGDVISDFATVDDVIHLGNGGFGSAVGTGTLVQAGVSFVLGTTATSANETLIYNQTTGQLFWDVNGIGSGGSTLLATLTSKANLSASDFLFV